MDIAQQQAMVENENIVDVASIEQARQLRAGDADAWHNALITHGPGVRTYLQCNLPSQADVDSLLAATFSTACAQAASLPADLGPFAWLCKLAHEQVLGFWQRHAQTNDLAERPGAALPVTEPTIRRAFGELLVDERRAMMLHDVLGLSVDEVAAVLGRRDVDIENILERGRDKLEEGIQLQGGVMP